MIKIFSSILGFAAFIAVAGWILSYGFNPYPCEYTYKELKLPELFVNTRIVLHKNTYLLMGNPFDSCAYGPPIPSNEIIDASLENMELATHSSELEGRTFEVLPKGETFGLIQVLARTHHGIGSVDSGSGPDHFLILKDAEGKAYRLSAAYLFNPNEESFLAELLSGDSRARALSGDFFYKQLCDTFTEWQKDRVFWCHPLR